MFIFDVNIARYWELLHQSVIKINSTMLRSNRASVPSVVRSLYIKKKDKFRIQMYKEIKENLINISSSILSVQNKMVNVYYKGNMNLKIKRLRRNI
jgi:hypothetical protein